MPTDQIDSFRVICEGGLNTNDSTLVLAQDQPGAATKLINFESAIAGGYRRINGFTIFNEDFAEVGAGTHEGKILWTGTFYNPVTEAYETMAARAVSGGATYEFFLFDAGTGWNVITTPVRDMVGTYSEVLKVRHAEFNFGSGNNIIFVDGVNPALWFDGTTWSEILAANTGASAASPGGNQVVDAPSQVTIFKGHIFLGGDPTPTGQARYCHSAPLIPYDWTSASGGGQLFPGFDTVGLRPFRDELYVFGLNKIRKALPDSSGFVQQDVTNDIGCVATDSILEVGGNLIFLSNDGIRPVAGTEKINDVELGLLSQNIQPLMDSVISEVDFNTLNGVVIRKKTQFRYTWGNDTIIPSESRGLIGTLRNNKRTGRNWEFGELYGIRTSCMWSGLVDRKEVVLHGDYNGKVYRQEQGSSFDGENIMAIYSTPFLDIGATDVRKLLREINTFMDAEGSATIFIGLAFDWDLGNVVTPVNYSGLVASGNSFYDMGDLYDDPDTTYGAALRTIITTKLQGSCFSVKFSFVNSGTDQPFTIQGFIPEYSIKGRN